jgi:hypothetical protein
MGFMKLQARREGRAGSKSLLRDTDPSGGKRNDQVPDVPFVNGKGGEGRGGFSTMNVW